MSDERPHRPRRGRQPSPATVREIYRRLRSALGPLDPPRRLDPLEELVVTVLSQNTSDVNRDRAYAAMRRRFPTWDALPVDTHVFRVARRLGFLDQRTDAARAHSVMEDAVPSALRVRMHVGMIRLGREICRAGRPRCEVCPLQDLCPTSPSVLKEHPTLRRPRRNGRKGVA